MVLYKTEASVCGSESVWERECVRARGEWDWGGCKTMREQRMRESERKGKGQERRGGLGRLQENEREQRMQERGKCKRGAGYMRLKEDGAKKGYSARERVEYAQENQQKRERKRVKERGKAWCTREGVQEEVLEEGCEVVRERRWQKRGKGSKRRRRCMRAV